MAELTIPIHVRLSQQEAVALTRIQKAYELKSKSEAVRAAILQTAVTRGLVQQEVKSE